VLIYDLEGELFFGGAPELDRYLEVIKEKTIASGIKYLVLRFRRARNPDVVAIEHLEHFLHEAEKRSVTVLLAGIRPDLQKILHNARFQDWLPADRIFPEEGVKYSATLHAVRHAYELLRQKAGEEKIPLTTGQKEAIYYLV
jgi:SulP family sulfate permease